MLKEEIVRIEAAFEKLLEEGEVITMAHRWLSRAEIAQQMGRAGARDPYRALARISSS
jgi:hypothetical protein